MNLKTFRPLATVWAALIRPSTCGPERGRKADVQNYERRANCKLVGALRLESKKDGSAAQTREVRVSIGNSAFNDGCTLLKLLLLHLISQTRN